MMRVAIVAEVYLPKIDGVVHRTLHLIRCLQRRGVQVLVVCPEAAGCDQGSVPIVAVPSFSFPAYPEYRVGLPNARLTEAIRRFAPDVLHFVNPFAFGFRCYDLLQKAGLDRPTVFSFHTLYGEFVKRYAALQPLSKLLWWMMRQYHNRADVNITVSEIMREDLDQRGFQRVRCWPPAVDSQLFHADKRSAAMRARLARQQMNRPLLITVSRLAPEKNVAFLRPVLERLPDATLAIIGDGPQRSELERHFEGHDVHFVGYLQGAELATAYASSDAFVYASETETMGNVVLEAMACGCPVIAPRAGGIPNLVQHDETGLLYLPGSVDEASAACRALLAAPDLSSRLAVAARAAVANWTWEESIDRVREHYAEAIEVHWSRQRKVTWGQRSAGAVNRALVTAFRAQSAIRGSFHRNGKTSTWQVPAS